MQPGKMSILPARNPDRQHRRLRLIRHHAGAVVNFHQTAGHGDAAFGGNDRMGIGFQVMNQILKRNGWVGFMGKTFDKPRNGLATTSVARYGY